MIAAQTVSPTFLQNVPQIVTAIGGLGTAAFGLVDATKVLWGGVNQIGFAKIKQRITALTPGATALSQNDIIKTLRANWFNGTDLGSQKAIAKSLIQLNFNVGNAAALAEQTGLAPAMLTTIATSIAAGTALTPAENDVFGRFDLILTALLDETYQFADQVYRNGTRVWAVVFSLALALAGGAILHTGGYDSHDFWKSVIVGLLATPLAPIAKDLSTALATAVNTLQLVKK